MKEVFKVIAEFPAYKVSNKGQVYSIKRKRNLKLQSVKDGVLKVSMKKDDKKYSRAVHRLVATTFISNIGDKPQVDHIDGNKQNNETINLRWCTNEENQAYRHAQGNTGGKAPHKQIQWGIDIFTSIRALSKHIANLRGSKEETIRKELKAVRYGDKVLYGKMCKLL